MKFFLRSWATTSAQLRPPMRAGVRIRGYSRILELLREYLPEAGSRELQPPVP